MRVGLIVNPIAGVGGRVGLRGSDGEAVQREALRRGAVPAAGARTAEALALLASAADRVELLVWSEEMGAKEAREAGFRPVVLRPGSTRPSTADDTRAAALEMSESGASLLLFAGGDGTAVDVLDAVSMRVTVLGIPAGVKMHSGVFALTPATAGRLALRVINGECTETCEGEVADVDEDLLNTGVVSPRIHGVLRVPAEPREVQPVKVRGLVSQESELAAVASELEQRFSDGRLVIVGPGTTTAAVLEWMGLRSTLLGVDVVQGGQLLAKDANETQILGLLDRPDRASIVVAPVGGQGFVLGRGNQQISAAVVRRIGVQNLVVIATESKLASLQGRPLRVDTGDPELDASLSGYLRLISGRRREIVYRIES